jgi:hypothetical protein
MYNGSSAAGLEQLIHLSSQSETFEFTELKEMEVFPLPNC